MANIQFTRQLRNVQKVMFHRNRYSLQSIRDIKTKGNRNQYISLDFIKQNVLYIRVQPIGISLGDIIGSTTVLKLCSNFGLQWLEKKDSNDTSVSNIMQAFFLFAMKRKKYTEKMIKKFNSYCFLIKKLLKGQSSVRNCYIPCFQNSGLIEIKDFYRDSSSTHFEKYCSLYAGCLFTHKTKLAYREFANLDTIIAMDIEEQSKQMQNNVNIYNKITDAIFQKKSTHAFKMIQNANLNAGELDALNASYSDKCFELLMKKLTLTQKTNDVLLQTRSMSMEAIEDNEDLQQLEVKPDIVNNLLKLRGL